MPEVTQPLPWPAGGGGERPGSRASAPKRSKTASDGTGACSMPLRCLHRREETHNPQSQTAHDTSAPVPPPSAACPRAGEPSEALRNKGGRMESNGALRQNRCSRHLCPCGWGRPVDPDPESKLSDLSKCERPCGCPRYVAQISAPERGEARSPVRYDQMDQIDVSQLARGPKDTANFAPRKLESGSTSGTQVGSDSRPLHGTGAGGVSFHSLPTGSGYISSTAVHSTQGMGPCLLMQRHQHWNVRAQWRPGSHQRHGHNGYLAYSGYWGFTSMGARGTGGAVGDRGTLGAWAFRGHTGSQKCQRCQRC